jgi:Zn-dependent protease with chaperone function
VSVSVPFALPWLAFAIAWFSLGFAAVALHWLVRPALARLPSEQRAAMLLTLAVLPFVAGVLVAVLGFAPEIGGLAVNGHCHAGQGCGPHVPMLHASVIAAAGTAGLIVIMSAALLWRFAERLRRSLALAGTLHSLAEAAGDDAEFAVVDSGVPFAYCIGLLRPRLVVSRGLLARLSAGQRGAVVAHERAHARRFDNLRHWLAAASLWFVPQPWRAALLRDLAVAAEQACDVAAVGAAGETQLAGALRMLGACEADIAARIGNAGAAAPALPATGALALVVLTYTLCVLPALDVTHYVVEQLIAVLG